MGPLYISCPDVAVVQLCREKWKTAGKRCTRVCNQRGKWCTERYEPCSALQTLRFLGHSLTSFGHDATASVTSSGRKPCKRSVGLPVFHRLRPPDEHHRNLAISGAQVRRGETRQDLKIPTVSDGSLPRALSCSHREVYPLQTAVRWRFLIPTRATGFLLGGSLQAGMYARTPRSTRLPRLSGNCTLESNPERHDESPLAVAIGDRFTERSSVYKYT